MTNNRVEAYNLLIGTRFLNKNAIKDPIIIADLAIIIAALDAKGDFKSIAINKIYQSIWTSFECLGKITLKHVLRNQNKDADSHANKAIDRQVAIVKENNEVYEESIPWPPHPIWDRERRYRSEEYRKKYYYNNNSNNIIIIIFFNTIGYILYIAKKKKKREMKLVPYTFRGGLVQK